MCHYQDDVIGAHTQLMLTTALLQLPAGDVAVDDDGCFKWAKRLFSELPIDYLTGDLDSTQEAAAHYLFYNVVCDLANCLVCLGSKGGWSFVSGLVQALTKLFDITHVIDFAYHPRVQVVDERPHRECSRNCKTFMVEYSDWDLDADIFVWSAGAIAYRPPCGGDGSRGIGSHWSTDLPGQ